MEDLTSCEQILVEMEKRILTLQNQQKWNDLKENIKVGDVKLLKTNNTNQNKWPMVRIAEKIQDKDRLVWSVKLCIGK